MPGHGCTGRRYCGPPREIKSISRTPGEAYPSRHSPWARPAACFRGCPHRSAWPRCLILCLTLTLRVDLKATNIMCKLPEATSSDKLQVLLAAEPSRRHPPEPSWDYPVEAAVSQPLPPPALDQALSASFVIAD